MEAIQIPETGTRSLSATLFNGRGGNGTRTYSADRLPSGLVINSSTGAITGTPNTVGSNTTTTVTVTVVDSDANENSTDTASATLDITIANDITPAFAAGADVNDLTLVAGWSGNASVTLPAVQSTSRGNAAAPNENNAAAANAVVYTLVRTATPTVDLSTTAGISFDASTRVLSFDTDLATENTFGVTYRAHDADTNTAAADSDTITFNITVQSDATPDFGTRSVAAQTYIAGYTTDPPTYINLPRQVTSGNISTTYSVSTDLTASNFPGNALPNNQDASQLPLGLSYNAAQHRIQGTSQNAHTSITVTLTVRDFDGDTDTLTFTLVTNADVTPGFGTATIADQTYTEDEQISNLVLPAVDASTPGNPDVAYSIVRTNLAASNFHGNALPNGQSASVLPLGLSFDAGTRTLSGTPTNSHSAIRVTYRATDADGDTAELTFNLNVGRIHTAPATIALQEGSQQLLRVRLQSRPSGTVRLNIRITNASGNPISDDGTKLRNTNGGANVDSITRTFTTSDYFIYQSFWAFAGEDNDLADESNRVTITVDSTQGANYEGISRTLNFTTTDNDSPGLVFFNADDESSPQLNWKKASPPPSRSRWRTRRKMTT